ncbi:hypothetical protein M501DRAFT_991796 [Patellaria atrata CBS 101060]|uniref:Zn(2)-C6 fungal-type domain-containing protein n=1 Tax=Patellaria atrata CBS 101060 TaxID=1346257 RepID=A0A9P4VRV8_9PEZI|nr:hypothetical protein M501DRAFT_991796 [Patellaria atrata CBS 101060]
MSPYSKYPQNMDILYNSHSTPSLGSLAASSTSSTISSRHSVSVRHRRTRSITGDLKDDNVAYPPRQRDVTTKLRAACDFCHSAKVKCTGEATCARCKNYAVPCVYSFAIKAGKPKGSKNKKTIEKLEMLRLRADTSSEQSYIDKDSRGSISNSTASPESVSSRPSPPLGNEIIPAGYKDCPSVSNEFWVNGNVYPGLYRNNSNTESRSQFSTASLEPTVGVILSPTEYTPRSHEHGGPNIWTLAHAATEPNCDSVTSFEFISSGSSHALQQTSNEQNNTWLQNFSHSASVASSSDLPSPSSISDPGLTVNCNCFERQNVEMSNLCAIKSKRFDSRLRSIMSTLDAVDSFLRCSTCVRNSQFLWATVATLQLLVHQLCALATESNTTDQSTDQGESRITVGDYLPSTDDEKVMKAVLICRTAGKASAILSSAGRLIEEVAAGNSMGDQNLGNVRYAFQNCSATLEKSVRPSQQLVYSTLGPV